MADLKYMDIVTDIKAGITEGALKPNDKIQSENELSEKYNLSRQTVRHAISVLENEGLVIRIKGSGTYVAENAITDKKNRNTIVVITTYVDAYIFPQMIQHIESVLSKEGYNVQICFTYNRISREKTILESIIEKDDVAGVICEATKSHLPNPNIKYYKILRENKIPVLFLNSYYENLEVSHVSINDVQAGKIATEYVIEKGHKRIGGIFKLDDGQGAKRYYGFLEAMNNAGLKVTGNDVVWFDTVDTEKDEYVEMLFERIRARLNSRTALVFYNDETALKLLGLFRDRGIQIPEDVSVIGIDDSVISPDENVKITSVIFPTKMVAEKAAENMIKMIKDPLFEGTFEFDLQIMERDSVKKL